MESISIALIVLVIVFIMMMQIARTDCRAAESDQAVNYAIVDGELQEVRHG